MSNFELIKYRHDVLQAKHGCLRAESERENLSEQYRFYSTSNVIKLLKDRDYFISDVLKTSTRIENKREFEKYIVRFQSLENELRSDRSEIVLINSHDGSSALQLRAGYFRLVCSNGSIDSAPPIRILHKGQQANLAELVDLSIQETKKTEQKVLLFENTQVREDQMIEFANSALRDCVEAKYDDLARKDLLSIHRSHDRGSDAWTRFNVVQENLLNGYFRVLYEEERGFKGYRKSKKIKSVDRIVEVNTKLWDLAEKHLLN